MRITSIQRPPRKRRYQVCLDHKLVASLSPDVLASAGLHTGQEITGEQLAELEAAEARHTAMAAALRLLAYGPRSEKQIRDALRRRRVRPQVLEATLSRLRELRLLDDTEFARSYVDLRDRASPRSRRLLRAELLARGVDRQSAEAPLGEVDEGDAAYRAAARRARSLSAMPFPEFQQRLGGHLQRRGFGYEAARETVRRLWLELRGEMAAGGGLDDALQ